MQQVFLHLKYESLNKNLKQLPVARQPNNITFTTLAAIELIVAMETRATWWIQNVI